MLSRRRSSSPAPCRRQGREQRLREPALEERVDAAALDLLRESFVGRAPRRRARPASAMPGDALTSTRRCDDVRAVERELQAEPSALRVPHVRGPFQPSRPFEKRRLPADRERGVDERPRDRRADVGRGIAVRGAGDRHDAAGLREPVHEHPVSITGGSSHEPATPRPRSPAPSSTSGCATASPTRASRRARGRRRSRSRWPATSASGCTCTSTSGRRRSSRSGWRRRPVCPRSLLCTSGTAAANFHPAVLEASHARVPMIVCTADRPPELRDTGAGQTIDQQKLYGDAVRWFHDPGVPSDRPGVGRAVACDGVAGVRGGRRRRRPGRCTSTCRSASPWCRPARSWSSTTGGPTTGRGRHEHRACARRRSGCSTRSRTSSPTRRAGWSSRDGAPAREPNTVLPLRRRCRVAGARGPDLGAAGARDHLDLRPAAARPVVRRRAATRRRAADRRPAHEQGRDPVARPATSVRCSSIPTARGSTRTTPSAAGWRPTPSSCSRRSPTRST